MAADLGGDAETWPILAVEVRRLADRLHSMSDVKLRQPLTPEATRASAVLDLAQRLAEAAQGIEARGDATEPSWRIVPDVGVLALGDQIAVTGQDLVAAVTGLGPDERVWTRSGQRPVSAGLAELVGAVRALRQAL